MSFSTSLLFFDSTIYRYFSTFLEHSVQFDTDIEFSLHFGKLSNLQTRRHTQYLVVVPVVVPCTIFSDWGPCSGTVGFVLDKGSTKHTYKYKLFVTFDLVKNYHLLGGLRLKLRFANTKKSFRMIDIVLPTWTSCKRFTLFGQ